ALMDEGYKPEKTVFCNGKFTLKGADHKYRCWRKEGHGSLNLHRALVKSCNVYFYNLALDLGYKKVVQLARQFQFSSKTGIDLPGEVSSQLSTPSWKRNQLGEPWYQGDAINAIIGQGYTLISPVKQAQLMGELLTGRSITPRVASVPGEKGKSPHVDIPKKVRKRFRKTLDQVTETGTGYWAQHTPDWQKIHPDVIGKTGTVQKVRTDNSGDTPPSDAWFISAAPVENPQYVVVVFRAEAGSGGQAAAPHARKIYQFMDQLNYFPEPESETS
ncbi:MAG: penicillin-binding transpeptidase domain-containing protein, partial [bacterium]